MNPSAATAPTSVAARNEAPSSSGERPSQVLLRQRTGHYDSDNGTPTKATNGNEFKLRPSTARTQAVLNVVSGIEGVDMQLMPASFKSLQSDFRWALQDLGSLVFYQSVSQAISGLLWGLLADRTSRVRLLALGCAGWGVVAVLLASATKFWQFCLLKALNGVAMASIGPVAQSLIADLFPPTMRGEHFGWLQLFLCAGCILGAMIGGSVANLTVIEGVKGWRVAFFSAGVISLFAAALVQIVAKEPRRSQQTKKTIIASLLTACPLVGGLLGSLFGGWLGDQAEKWSPCHGRPLVGQCGTLLALPLIYIGLLGIPRRPEYFGFYAVDMLVLGFAISWCPTGVNRPILSEIVEANSRATVFATQIAIEGSVSAMLGSPVIALLAESIFGYRTGVPFHAAADSQRNTDALANALLVATAFPWTVCFFLYGLMHFTYPKDSIAYERHRRGDSKMERDSK